MYQFRMSIGDWSDDGHGEHDDFVVASNCPVEKVREAHFAMKERTGINIEDLCSEYGEDEINEDTVAKIRKLGFSFENNTGNGDGILYPEDMAKLWLFLLMKSDPDLKLELAEEDDIPTLHFYGFDEKKRHIGQVGYGLF